MTSSNDRPPINPYVVLVLAICFRARATSRSGSRREASGFAFFAVLLALLTWYTTTPERSFIGRAAGGLFVWACRSPMPTSSPESTTTPG